MNFHLVVFLGVVACAMTIPIPDEEVSTLLKTESVTTILTTVTDASVKVSTEDPIATAEPTETSLKIENESDAAKPTEITIESTSIADDNKKEEPISLPVTAREGTAVVPLFSGARVEPKEGVEVGESKSSASSPDTEETEEKTEPKPKAVAPLTTEKPIAGSIPKQDSSSASAEDKTKVESTKIQTPTVAEQEPVVTAVNKSSVSTTPKTDSKESDKSSAKSKSSESSKEKHSHSSEHKDKADDSAESKESDESNESSNTK